MELEKDFKDFCSILKEERFSKQDIENICKPLYNYQRKEVLKKYSKIILAGLLCYALLQWCDCFNWFISALGRLALIQILPVWNWPALYNAKCLIERPLDNNNVRQASTLPPNTVDFGNCLLCENIDFIPTVSNVTFSTLETFYLESGLPVVIIDSHSPITGDDFFHTIFHKSSIPFLQSSHCDISSNLIIKKFFNTELVLRKAWKLLDTSEKWFIQFRICQASAVRNSRLFMKKPYYYPVHLEPYYSSWLIMSNNFSHRQYQEISVQGLIIVQQLSGTNNLRLKPKRPCDENCPLINVQLKEGEALVFSSDLWEISYKQIKSHQASIATIMEIDWNI